MKTFATTILAPFAILLCICAFVGYGGYQMAKIPGTNCTQFGCLNGN